MSRRSCEDRGGREAGRESRHILCIHPYRICLPACWSACLLEQESESTDVSLLLRFFLISNYLLIHSQFLHACFILSLFVCLSISLTTLTLYRCLTLFSRDALQLFTPEAEESDLVSWSARYACLSMYLFSCLPVYLSACLPVCLPACLSF